MMQMLLLLLLRCRPRLRHLLLLLLLLVIRPIRHYPSILLLLLLLVILLVVLIHHPSLLLLRCRHRLDGRRLDGRRLDGRRRRRRRGRRPRALHRRRGQAAALPLLSSRRERRRGVARVVVPLDLPLRGGGQVPVEQRGDEPEHGGDGRLGPQEQLPGLFLLLLPPLVLVLLVIRGIRAAVGGHGGGRGGGRHQEVDGERDGGLQKVERAAHGKGARRHARAAAGVAPQPPVPKEGEEEDLARAPPEHRGELGRLGARVRGPTQRLDVQQVVAGSGGSGSGGRGAGRQQGR